EKVGLKPIGGYKMHNWDFMWAAATMEGNSEIAFRAAKFFHEQNSNDMRLIYSQVRFGKWDDLLATIDGRAFTDPYRIALAYGKAIAYARKGDLKAAQSQYSDLLDLMKDSSRTVYKIERDVAAGEIAAARGDYTAAVRSLESAKDEEDSMGHAELAGWHQPVRQVIGKVLIDAGRFADAEKAYRENLEVDPENGWSLIGLAQALQGQGKTADATRVMARFHLAWQYADVQLTASEM
ncbi:MAG TPA: tetratricopeptide repeat protein, partial [Fimbriimonadaceae bacterium]|nr:tetratricopeptide repeat protein [Fimbriimonadaceae bacterium]